MMQYSQYPMPVPASQLPQNGKPKINPEQFKAWLPKLNNNMLSQLQQQARAQGISEEEINQGMSFINSLRSDF